MQVSIGKQLKQVLDIDSSIRIGFLAHVRMLLACRRKCISGILCDPRHHWF